MNCIFSLIQPETNSSYHLEGARLLESATKIVIPTNRNRQLVHLNLDCPGRIGANRRDFDARYSGVGCKHTGKLDSVPLIEFVGKTASDVVLGNTRRQDI